MMIFVLYHDIVLLIRFSFSNNVCPVSSILNIISHSIWSGQSDFLGFPIPKGNNIDGAYNYKQLIVAADLE